MLKEYGIRPLGHRKQLRRYLLEDEELQAEAMVLRAEAEKKRAEERGRRGLTAGGTGDAEMNAAMSSGAGTAEQTASKVAQARLKRCAHSICRVCTLAHGRSYATPVGRRGTYLCQLRTARSTPVVALRHCAQVVYMDDLLIISSRRGAHHPSAQGFQQAACL